MNPPGPQGKPGKPDEERGDIPGVWPVSVPDRKSVPNALTARWRGQYWRLQDDLYQARLLH